MTPVFKGRIEGGQIMLERRPEFSALITSLDGKDIEIVLRRHRKVRSDKQNRYLHGVVVPLFAEHCGYDAGEMKDALKMRFLQKDGGPLPTVRSTAELDTAEMTIFIDQVRMLAAEMGCMIPAPGEVE